METNLDQVALVTAPVVHLDAAGARELLRLASAELARRPRAMIIDLSPVNHVDSLGISALVSIAQRSASTKVVLVGLSSYVQTVARVTRLHDVFDIYRDLDGARRALAA